MLLVILEPQRFYGLVACTFLGELLAATVHGMASQDAVDEELAPPFWVGIRVPVAFVNVRFLLVAPLAF